MTEQGLGSLNQSLATLDGMKLKRIRKMKSAEKEETSVSSEAASGNGNGQTAGAAGSADITDSAGAADHAKTTGSANTTDDAEMAAGTSASGSAGTESKDSAEQEAAGAGTASGAAGNQAEKAAESATKTEDKDAEVNAFGTEVYAGALTAGPSGEPGSGGVNDASWEDEIGNAEDDVEEALESLSATTYSADAASLVEETKGIFQKVEQAQKTAKTIVNKVNGAFKTAGDLTGKTGSTLSALRSSPD